MNNLNSIEQAKAMIEKFRLEKENILAPKYQWTNIFPRCEVFDKKQLQEMLAIPACNLILMYPGLDENNQFRFVAVCAASETGIELPEESVKEKK